MSALMTLLALALAAEPAVNHNTTPAPCHLQVVKDYDLLFVYRAVLQLSPDCPYSAVLRVRKSSTLNVVRNGAPYQPVLPTVGAWNFGWLPALSTVPSASLWTSSTWRWEYYDPTVWSTRLQAYGRWIAAEELYAAPQ